MNQYFKLNNINNLDDGFEVYLDILIENNEEIEIFNEGSFVSI